MDRLFPDLWIQKPKFSNLSGYFFYKKFNFCCFGSTFSLIYETTTQINKPTKNGVYSPDRSESDSESFFFLASTLVYGKRYE